MTDREFDIVELGLVSEETHGIQGRTPEGEEVQLP